MGILSKFLIRRTKLQVLEFLPPVAQMIVPVTMSIVQKKLYKSILAKNPELIKSVFSQSVKTLRPSERGNLNNILMQLRKCLCHPFLYSSAIEDRSFGDQTLYRNLVDASSKFQLLEIMLPKLHKRGHRALIFSQFLHNLDLIEDFLTGLDLPFQRLDGSINSMEKQKRIDEFNAPNSPLFAFLLSTRAGGVGINLATADTVLIMVCFPISVCESFSNSYLGPRFQCNSSLITILTNNTKIILASSRYPGPFTCTSNRSAKEDALFPTNDKRQCGRENCSTRKKKVSFR